MGDRVNIAVQTDGKRVYFYGHWSGSEAPDKVRNALAKRARWTDPSYLARIVFCEFVKGHESGEIGFGISSDVGDNEYPIIVVDADAQQVRFEDHDRAYICRGAVGKAFSFEEYLQVADGWEAIESAHRLEDVPA